MSIYKVDRRVDTVIIEMDITNAEQLVEILDLVQDNTRMSQTHPSAIRDLQGRLLDDAEVRFPSPLYSATVHPVGYVELTDVR